jgi:hypothetical protein
LFFLSFLKSKHDKQITESVFTLKLKPEKLSNFPVIGGGGSVGRLIPLIMSNRNSERKKERNC